MISMTGFGRAEKHEKSYSITVEIRTVNGRFLDFNFKAPREYMQYEFKLKELVSKVLNRGRVDVTIVKTLSNNGILDSLNLNHPLFNAYLKLYENIQERYSLSETAKESFINELLLKKDLIDVLDVKISESEESALFDVMGEAVNSVYQMRQREGSKLAHEITSQLVYLKHLREKILTEANGGVEIYRKKLLDRIKKLSDEIELDPARLETEVALFADRIDITEEIARLKSHFEQFEIIAETVPNGRPLDFLIQECGREFNTIASKAQSAHIQALVVSGKTCLEKIREQIQNIE